VGRFGPLSEEGERRIVTNSQRKRCQVSQVVKRGGGKIVLTRSWWRWDPASGEKGGRGGQKKSSFSQKEKKKTGGQKSFGADGMQVYPETAAEKKAGFKPFVLGAKNERLQVLAVAKSQEVHVVQNKISTHRNPILFKYRSKLTKRRHGPGPSFSDGPTKG